MSKENIQESISEIKEPAPVIDKEQAHRERIIRTFVACIMGVIAGVISYFISGDLDPLTGLQSNGIIGVLLLLAGIVFQKHVFMLLKIDYTQLGGKDWFYQTFMTFSLWFISWTILLTTSLPLQ